MQLIECVPNFSEGRDRAVIDAIVAAIAGIEGTSVLDVAPGEATNRTVVTFVGDAAAVEEGAFRAIAEAARLIDMTRHKGEHPRMGATDVCPFVPVSGVTMEDCVAIARRLGERVGRELGIPVYLYEAAATRPGNLSLADVRRGEYEGLAARTDPPDFGPAFSARSGATAIGARRFLIAYNVNLNTRNRHLAEQIAGAVRASGVVRRDASGAIVCDATGTALRVAGRFSAVKGVGWYIEEYGRAQVSLNLTDFTVSPLHEVFDACIEEAAALGVRVTGSEIVGLVPREALLAAADHYLVKQGATRGVPEAERIHMAVISLGLAELGPFDPNEKVIEYRVKGKEGGMATMSLTGFVDEVSSDSFAPGGGSVAALCGSLGAALASMVAALTWSKKGMEDVRLRMEEMGRRAQDLKDWFLAAVEADANAYNAVIAARRLPKGTAAEQAARAEAVDLANQEATRIPLEVAARGVEALQLISEGAIHGNPNSITDAGVAALVALAAVEGAGYNVRINLASVEDDAVRTAFATALEQHLTEARRVGAAIREAVERALL